jgi:hypothetical protein
MKSSIRNSVTVTLLCGAIACASPVLAGGALGGGLVGGLTGGLGTSVGGVGGNANGMGTIDPQLGL